MTAQLPSARLRLGGLLAALASIASCFHPAHAAPPRRRALVLANGAYSTQPLPYSVEGAERFAAALRDVGFEVVPPRWDLDREATIAALDAFASGSSKGDVSLIYYSGHGFQTDQRNYLVPTGAEKVATLKDAVDGSVAIEPWVAKIRGRTRIVVLDACRNTPFADRGFTGWREGLAEPRDQVPDTFFGFATAPGLVTPDGNRDVTLYTQLLIRFVQRPGMRLSELFRALHDVLISSKQSPWINASIGEEDDIVFRAPSTVRFRFSNIDDDAILTVNGDLVVHAQAQGSSATTVTLRSGENPFAVLVFNQRSLTKGLPKFGGEQPEGWSYRAEIEYGAGQKTVLEDREDRPERDGPHHGKWFTVATGVLRVDELTGQVTVEKLDAKAR